MQIFDDCIFLVYHEVYPRLKAQKSDERAEKKRRKDMVGSNDRNRVDADADEDSADTSSSDGAECSGEGARDRTSRITSEKQQRTATLVMMNSDESLLYLTNCFSTECNEENSQA